MKAGRTVLAPPAGSLITPAPHGNLPLAVPLAERIAAVQALTAAPPGRALRRLLFVWFRIFVWEERRNGETSRVNLRLPLPIPLIGGLLARRVGPSRALALLADAECDPESVEAAQRMAESVMGFEFIRVVEERNGKREVVVIGFD